MITPISLHSSVSGDISFLKNARNFSFRRHSSNYEQEINLLIQVSHVEMQKAGKAFKLELVVFHSSRVRGGSPGPASFL